MDMENYSKNIQDDKISNDKMNLLFEAAAFVLIASVFFGLTFWSYRKWPDLLIDFGQQLYIPWRLAQGERLYADIAFFHGPFSQYFNALWFRNFGPSLSILICMNLMILAWMSFVMYKTLRLFTDVVTATVCLIFFLSVFAFAQYVGVGNYNWVTPYTHGATHGMALLATFIYLWSMPRNRYFKIKIMAGALCLGLAVTTKVDIALTAIIVGFIAMGVELSMRKQPHRLTLNDVFLFLVFFAIPSIGFFLYELTYLPLNKAWSTVAGCLPLVLSSDVAGNFFYMRVMGLDNIGYNLGEMFQMTFLILGLVVCAAVIDVLASKHLKRPLMAGIPIALVALVLMWQLDFATWEEIPRMLPVWVITTLAVVTFFFFRQRAGADEQKKLVPVLLWTVAAGALLIKMFFHVRFSMFGFYAAMPAALIMAACLLWAVPRMLQSKFQSGQLFRLLAFVFLAVLTINYLKLSDHFYRMKTYPIGRGQDMFYIYRPDRVFPIAVSEMTLRWIENNLPPQATFAALPEGVMFNYLTRRRTTIPTINFVMTELIIFGEDRILEEFKSQPPDYILLVHKESDEFGVGPFGVDHRNGFKIMRWVYQNYSAEKLIGREPFQSEIFGIKILKRNAPGR